MRKLTSISLGFVTNSSTMVTVIFTEPKRLLGMLNELSETKIQEFIDKYFKKFVTDKLKLDKTELEYYNDFLEKVKRNVFVVIEELRNFAHENVNNCGLLIKSECDIDGMTIDTDEPKTYALWFVLEYMLQDIASDKISCYC